jgi:hypothetical protein
MLIPLGILASSSGSNKSYELISTTILGSSQASVTFDVSTLASTYKHLQLRMSAKSTYTGTLVEYFFCRFNSDSGSNYDAHWLVGNASTVSSSASTSRTSLYAGRGDAITNSFEPAVMEITDAFSSSKNKTVRTFTGGGGSVNEVYLFSGLWRNTAAITSLTITGQQGNPNTGTRMSLYGIRG